MDLLRIPLENNYETTLSQTLTASASALTFYVKTAPTFTFPSSTKTRMILSAGKDGYEEEVLVESYNSSTKAITIASGGRAQPLYNGHSATPLEHPSGRRVIISDGYGFWNDIKTAVDAKVDTDADDTITANTTWSSTTKGGARMNNLTTAQRDALAAPANGMIIYNTTTGEMNQYIGGAWSAMASGSTQPNASETVAGKVEEATQSENNAGTAAGASADLFATPAKNAVSIQNSNWTYIADTGVADAYIAILTPAVTAYVDGLRLAFKAVNANTTASTLNVNSLGVKDIKKNGTKALVAGDIVAGQIVFVEYDGTQFQMLSPDNPLTTKGDLLVGTGSGVKARLAVSATNGQVLKALSTATEGVAWADVTKLYATTSDVTVNTTVTKTAIATFTLPGNTLSTNRVVVFEAHVSNMGIDQNGDTCTIGLEYGATSIATHVITGNAGLGSRTGIIRGVLFGAGTTSSQEGALWLDLSDGNLALQTAPLGPKKLAVGTASEVSTGDLVLRLVVTHSRSAAASTITVAQSYAFLIA